MDLANHYLDSGPGITRSPLADANTLWIEVVPKLLERAMDSLLSIGRTMTIERWLRTLELRADNPPIVHLAHADCAFRRGDFALAKQQALRATKLGTPPTIVARAFMQAAQAAYFSDGRDAQELAAQAFERSTSLSDRRSALWVQFLAISAEDKTAATSLLRLILIAWGSDSKRRSTPRRRQAGRCRAIWGRSSRCSTHLYRHQRLLNRCRIPMIRSSYFAARARNESFAARHRQALASIGIAETEAAQSNLTFAEPQIRMARVIASIGLRRVAAARRELKAIAKHGPLDPHDQANHGIQSARLALTLGNPQHASDILQRITGVADNATRGEVLAYRSFACALLSRFSESRALWADARAATSTIEAQVISRLAEAAAASDDELPELLECATLKAESAGLRDAVLLATRASDRLRMAFASMRGRNDHSVLHDAIDSAELRHSTCEAEWHALHT